MKNKVQLIILWLLLAIIAHAQSPNSFKYQAVIRNASGEILENQSVELKVSILQGSIEGNEVYSETHIITTNSFGLVNLEIGSINTNQFEAIDWSNSPYFLELTIDGNIMGTSQLLSVPYSLYANKAKEAENVFSGDYEDLENKPDLSDTSLFLKQEIDPIFNLSIAKSISEVDTSSWNNKSDFSGDYNSLINKPVLWDSSYNSIKLTPESISQFILDANNSRINNLATPKDSLDAVNKYYVDSLIKGSDLKNLSLAIAQGADLATLINSPLYTIEDLLIAGATPENLYNAGASVAELYSNGSTIAELMNFGATVQELVDANVPIGQLLSEGISISDLINAGVNASTLISIGVDVEALIAAGVVINGLEGVLEDTVDNQIYNWVGIGNQIWMTKNTNTTYFANGDEIEQLTINSDADSLGGIDKNYCVVYNNDITLAETYGRLYSQKVIYDNRNVCPINWHVPNKGEWNTLFYNMGVSESDTSLTSGYIGTDEGGKLKETGTDYWNVPNSGATNEVGFNALPSGYFEPFPETENHFYGLNTVAYYWLRGVKYPYQTIKLESGSAKIFIRDEYVGYSANSIRCIKN